MARFIRISVLRNLLKSNNYLCVQRIKYCTKEIDKNFINKNTILEPSSNYYDQYIEEYYEEEEDNNDDEKVIPLHLQKKIEKSYEEKEFIEKIKIDDLIQLLNNERALNIECINVIKDKNELKANEIAVICSPFNNKHAEALVNIVRSFVKDNYKFEDKQYPRLTRNNNGWFTYDMRKVILHVLTDKMRRKYDLESLYRNVKDEDEEVVDPFNDKPVISNDGNLN